MDETPPIPDTLASQELNPEIWSKWISCVSNPSLTVTEFLAHWNQANNDTKYRQEFNVGSSLKQFDPILTWKRGIPTIRNEVEEYEGEFLLIVSGWDGARYTSSLPQESTWQQKKFFEVNVAQVCSAFGALYVLIKEDISVVSTELCALTNVRNDQPESRNLSRHICGDCNILIPTSVDLSRHMYHKHENHEKPELDLRCTFCGYLFSDRHVKETCPRNRPMQSLTREVEIDQSYLLKDEPKMAQECPTGLLVPLDHLDSF
ncbi:hypothetical protein N7508_001563 [Penicillium antarcticum]|uniref:uncharacterized protein n=1 Tax=Penicillium antarcticum TaxID=416450 RepID=UPI002393D94B|nr:uncharacterized protein N7508_001563 [Penicillium antarcticum]KAJ5317055.1 hypothetical protein N7508_001563 [Penicillium antarcticum]